MLVCTAFAEAYEMDPMSRLSGVQGSPAPAPLTEA